MFLNTISLISCPFVFQRIAAKKAEKQIKGISAFFLTSKLLIRTGCNKEYRECIGIVYGYVGIHREYIQKSRIDWSVF